MFIFCLGPRATSMPVIKQCRLLCVYSDIQDNNDTGKVFQSQEKAQIKLQDFSVFHGNENIKEKMVRKQGE